MVDLKGAVAKPNVYQISSDERLVDLIRQAGGFTDQADQKSINLSAKLKDEEVIYVPKLGKVQVQKVLTVLLAALSVIKFQRQVVQK